MNPVLHAQYTIKTYAKMSLFALDLTGPLSVVPTAVGTCIRVLVRDVGITSKWSTGVGRDTRTRR